MRRVKTCVCFGTIYIYIYLLYGVGGVKEDVSALWSQEGVLVNTSVGSGYCYLSQHIVRL